MKWKYSTNEAGITAKKGGKPPFLAFISAKQPIISSRFITTNLSSSNRTFDRIPPHLHTFSLTGLILIKTFFKFALASLITLALIIWVEKTTGWMTILEQWQALSLQTLAVCFALTLFSHALRGARLIYCYQQLDGRPTFDSLLVIAISFIHNAANFILPMRLGEIVLPALSRYKLSISLKDSVKALLGIRLFDLHVLILLLVLLQKSLLGLWQIPLALLLIAGLGILPFCHRIKYVKALYPPQYRSYLSISITYALSLAIWCVKLIAFYWVFKAFADIPFIAAATGILTADLSSTLPINGFASAGSYEAAFAAGLYATGNLRDALVAAIINLHIFLLLSNIVAAAVGWFVLAIKK